MNKLLLYSVVSIITGGSANSQDLVKYVQPLSGTAPSTTTAAQKHSEAGSEKNANTIPAVGVPFGMTQWTPQTRTSETKCIPPHFSHMSRKLLHPPIIKLHYRNIKLLPN